jgi:hypothetical protein
VRRSAINHHLPNNFKSYHNDHVRKTETSINQKAGFEINEEKTRIQYKDSRQDVTGLIVNKKVGVKRVLENG